MITTKEKEEILRVNSKYKLLHDELNQIDHHLMRLTARQKAITAILEENRENEKELINKLEEKYKTKFTPNVLMEILDINLEL